MSNAGDVVRLDWEQANSLVGDAQQIIVVTHVNPDGDAFGSLLGLGLALRERGKTVTLAVDGGVLPDFRFLPGAATVLSSFDGALPPADLVISTDASSIDRIGEVGAAAFALGTPTIVIDHHATNTFFGDVTILNSGFVSSTEAVLEWLDQLGWEPSPQVAMALMTGLITDTISFRVGPVTAETFRKAMRLMALGVDLRGITERTLSRSRTGIQPLVGRGLERTQLEDHVIWTYLRLQDMADFGLTAEEKPELSSQILKDEQAYIAAFFYEVEGGDLRVSFRAKPVFDVGAVAFSLGGGGHTLASGCTLRQTTLEAAIAKVIPLLKAEVQRGTLHYPLE